MGGKKNKNKNKNRNRDAAGSPQDDHGGADANPGTAAAAAPTTAAFLMECEVCSHRFDEKGRKPRNLQCGHGFCTACCKALTEHQMITCPKCRRKTKSGTSAEDLPVNYPVLDIVMNKTTASQNRKQTPPKNNTAASQNRKPAPSKRDETSPHGGRCLEAQAEVSMHCAYCHMWLCKDCSRIDHSRPECLLTPFRETLAEMSQAGMAKVKSTQNTLKEFSSEAKAYDGKLRSFVTLLETTLDCVKREQGYLARILNDSQGMEEKIDDLGARNVHYNVEQDLEFLDGMEEATSIMQQWAVNAFVVLKGEQVFKLSKTLMQTAVQMHMTPRDNGGVMGLHNIKGVDVTLPMEMNGGRLLIHAARQRDPPTGSRVIKLEHIKSCIDPSCALTFLDISLRGQELGRMFIRILGNSKRSRCFLMMCTGETGPSFRNTRFHRLWWAGLPGQSVWAGDHDRGDGSGGALPAEILHETKELPEKTNRTAVTAGVVAGRCGKTNSTIFRVYTEQSTGILEDAAFGRVEYGINVLRDALENNKNIIDLTISGCGVVVEP